MSDFSRSLVDAAAEAMKPFDDLDLTWVTVKADEGEQLMSPATRRSESARAAVAAVLETLAAKPDGYLRHTEDGGITYTRTLRRLAVETRSAEDAT